MNPKGEEGEFYMKKSLLVLASIMILALCTFVACTAEVSDPYDGLTYVTFGGEAPASRNLLASYEVASYDSLYWFYTAEKKDNYGTSGAVANAPVHEGNTGLNNTVGPFSQGKWLFTLCAYKNNAVSEDAKVYEGSVEVSLKGQKVTVPVSVTPYGETGALEFRGAYFAWKNNSETSTAVPTIMIVAKGTTNGYEYDLSNSFTEIKGENTTKMEIPLVIKEKDSEGKFYIDDTEAKFGSVVADYYTSTIIAYIDDPNTPIFSQTLGFRVYGSTTTTISGDITEGEFTGVNFSVENMAVIEMSESSKASLSVTPSGVDDKTTDVDFSSAGLTGKHVLVVDVNSAVAASNFTIEGVDSDRQSIVAGIGLELSSVGEATQTPVTSFGNNGKVVVTTYIAKRLSNVTVKYNGTNGGDPTFDSYDPETGRLSFTTTHFSEFYVVADKVEAINLDTNVAYKSFVEAVNSIVKEGSVSLLSDVSLGSIGNTNEKIYIGDESGDTKSVSIDLCGHDINLLDSSLALINVKVELLGEGTIRRTGNTVNSAIWLFGSKENVSDYTVLTIGKEVLIDAAYGVSVNKNPNASQNKKDADYGRSCGVVVNLYGNINATYCGLYVNGTCESLDNAPAFNLNGVTIACGGTTNASGELCGIYAAGYAIWNIKGDTTITALDTAIEIRAGKMKIDGGTFTSTETAYSCTAEGNGTTTVGASIAVAQHNTKLPIDVTISNGTFKGYHALSVVNPQNNDYAAISKINVNVKDGKFTSTKAKKGVEAVNYSSEFKKIDDVSSFTIRARKDGDEGNVTSLPDGRFFSSLQGAVDGVKDGSTVSLTLLNDVYEGGSLIVEDGRNLRLTLDFNDKTYYAFKVNESSSPTSKVAFKFGKDNTVVLKKGTLTTKQKFNVTLVENYSNLTVNDFTIIGWKEDGSLFASSALTCHYGDTLITGESMIIGDSSSSYKAIDVSNDFSDSYSKGVTVEFDENFKGSVTGYVNFELDKKNKCAGAQYNHSLIINGNADCFKAAQFCFSRVGVKSVFQMNGDPNIHTNSKFPTRKDGNGATALDKDVAIVHNKTIDAIYEELSRAMTDTYEKFENELVMKKGCVLEYSISQPNGKTIILDLNGCEIKADTALKSSTGMFAVGSKGKLIIRDNSDDKGSIDSSNNSNVPCCIFVNSKGRLEIDSGITIKAAPEMQAATGLSSEIITGGYAYPSN